MNQRTKRILKLCSLTAGALATTGTIFLTWRKRRKSAGARDVWARPQMEVTFRAEVMPGREPSERTFRVKELLPSDRITLHNITGEHSEQEFERLKP